MEPRANLEIAVTLGTTEEDCVSLRINNRSWCIPEASARELSEKLRVFLEGLDRVPPVVPVL
jgi:hypothetical protein